MASESPWRQWRRSRDCQYCYGPHGLFSHIYSTGVQPLELQPDSAGLCLLASIVTAPLPQLGFVTVSLPCRQLAKNRFSCTNSLAVRSESGTQGARHNSCVYLAQLEGNTSAVLMLAQTCKKVGLYAYQLLSGMIMTIVCMPVSKATSGAGAARQQAPCFGCWPGPHLTQAA